MILFPAIDLYGGEAVRLYKGDYDKMTVYDPDPARIAADFRRCGAEAVHIVDLEGARDGATPNLETVLKIKNESGLFCEIGGGVRSMAVVDRYLSLGLDRVILGTAAVENEALLTEALGTYGEKIAVGADIRDGYIAIKGWTERSAIRAEDFFERMQTLGVRNIICTDISRDGAMRGTNLRLYKELSERFSVGITASGGVSQLSDVRTLKEMGLYGAIIGKAYYEKTLDLAQAVEVAR